MLWNILNYWKGEGEKSPCFDMNMHKNHIDMSGSNQVKVALALSSSWPYLGSTYYKYV